VEKYFLEKDGNLTARNATLNSTIPRAMKSNNTKTLLAKDVVNPSRILDGKPCVFGVGHKIKKNKK